MKSHRIQLKGPWDYDWKSVVVDSFGPASQTGTVTMPRDWQSIFGDRSGVAEFRRKFHRPTNVESHERVILNFTGIRGQIAVSLNRVRLGKFTGTGDGVEFDVTSLLKEFNELRVEITFDPQSAPDVSGGLHEIVALDIRWEET
jgi:beta-galactosidase/beta-glucuronidase